MTERSAPKASAKDRTSNMLLVWERCIETQMHFAELSIKSRQIGMTVVGATLALAVVLYRADYQFSVSVGSLEIPIASVLCWTAALVLYAIKLLDVGVYHQMLRGAVAFNEDFEQRNLLTLFGTEKGLTQAISFFSRHPGAHLKEGKYFESRAQQVQKAGVRISTFYWIMITALAVAGIALIVAGTQ